MHNAIRTTIAALALVLAAPLALIGAEAPANAGGNINRSMTWDAYKAVDEGQAGPQVQDICNDCYWYWTGYDFTWHGSNYQYRAYLAGQSGRKVFIAFRKGEDSRWHVGYEKAWSCDANTDHPVNCGNRHSFA